VYVCVYIAHVTVTWNKQARDKHCVALQHTAIHCNAPQHAHIAFLDSAWPRDIFHCNTAAHHKSNGTTYQIGRIHWAIWGYDESISHCNTWQHKEVAATHGNRNANSSFWIDQSRGFAPLRVILTLQHLWYTATHLTRYNTRQHNAIHLKSNAKSTNWKDALRDLEPLRVIFTRQRK